MEDEIADTGGGVDAFVEATKTDPTVLEFAHELHQMGEGSAEAVQLPYNQCLSIPK